jgi:glycerol-3-phosphate acyltransferase PlsY
MIASALAILAAYLIGGIPFGLLIARWAKGIDIRTVGSGNIGATNVGRVLGFRFFVVVFLLDMLKGLVPTLALPPIVDRASGAHPSWLPVLVALATIVGHNFPVYLRFRGGKGVATSFGALAALDPIAMLSAGIGFVIFLLITRYVSLSSLMAGLVFAAVHFTLFPDLWKGDQIAMTLVTLGLLVLLLARHRKNLARIRTGTEPKVSFRKKARSGPAGRVSVLLVLGLSAVGVVVPLSFWATRCPVLD